MEHTGYFQNSIPPTHLRDPPVYQINKNTRVQTMDLVLLIKKILNHSNKATKTPDLLWAHSVSSTIIELLLN